MGNIFDDELDGYVQQDNPTVPEPQPEPQQKSAEQAELGNKLFRRLDNIVGWVDRKHISRKIGIEISRNRQKNKLISEEDAGWHPLRLWEHRSSYRGRFSLKQFQNGYGLRRKTELVALFSLFLDY